LAFAFVENFTESKKINFQVERRELESGRPDECVGKITQNVAQTRICQNQRTTFTEEKSSQKIGLPLKSSKNLPKVSNCPMGVSPNLVTLVEMNF
jgi:hypothetical protein